MLLNNMRGKSEQQRATCFLTGRHRKGDQTVLASATENYRQTRFGKGEKVE